MVSGAHAARVGACSAARAFAFARHATCGTTTTSARRVSLVHGVFRDGERVRAHATASNGEANGEDGMDFRALGVGVKLSRRLASVGIKTPSIAQRAAMPAVMQGENVAMQSHTGSGKTLAYILPIINSLMDDDAGTIRKDVGNGVRAIIVAPSQELAMQIVRQIERVLGELGKAITQQAIGGANAKRQEEAIRRKRPLIVVGTPGRLAELSRSGILQTHGVRVLVVDEADDLLASNFRRDMARISEHTGKGVPGGRQTIIVSATLKQETLDAYSYLAPNLKHIVASYDKPPETELTKRVVGEDGEEEEAPEDNEEQDEKSAAAASKQARRQGVVSLPPHITHCQVIAERRHKVDELRRAIHATDVQRALIFCNFGRRLQDVQAKLGARGMPVGVLHGGMDKMERARELAAFRRGAFRALVVSDLAARGLDVDDCDAVFNLELPTDETHYVHRAGRTGRMGSPGVVVTIAEPQEAFVVQRFEKNLGVKINEIATKGGEVVRSQPSRAPVRPPRRRAPPRDDA